MKRTKAKIGDDGADGKSKKKRSDAADSVFSQLLRQAGAELSATEQIELEKDGSIFQRNMLQILKRHDDYPQIVSEFMESLSKHIEDSGMFRSFLMPAVVVRDAEDVVSRGSQESLIRLLLGIDILQPQLMCMLVEKLAEAENSNCAGKQVETLPRLIMNQFRWLDRIVNAKDLVEKMFEVVSVAEIDVQREIISCLPEIVDDQQHSEVAKQLRELVLSNPQLHVTILDVLTNLNLSPDLLSDVRESVVQILPSTDLDSLPVIMNFLLRTCTPIDALQVVSDIRLNMDLKSLLPITSTPHDSTRTQSDAIRDSVTLVLDVVRSSIRFQKFIADAWIKALESVKTATDHKVLDVLLIVVLHSCGHAKQAEALCRTKISAGHVTEALLQTTFTSHSRALRDYFPSILSLAEVLLRHSQLVVSSFACIIYRHAFVAFDSYCQQEIVGNLVTHIGCGVHAEIQSSLDILLDLVTNNTQKMAPFAIFIKGVLDYLDNLDMSEIRKLYSMLACLAFAPKQSDSMLQGALHIIIRKQLSNSVARYQQMGVIGAIAVVTNMAKITKDYYGLVLSKRATSEQLPPLQSPFTTRPGSSGLQVYSLFPDFLGPNCPNEDSLFLSSLPENTNLPEEVYRQVIDLLQLVKTSSNRSPEISALFTQELARVVKRGVLHSKIVEWIAENVTSDFQDDFVIDVGPSVQHGEDGLLPWSLQFGLDALTDGSIAINLAPLVTPSRQLFMQKNSLSKSNAARLVSAWCMASQFGLLQICEWRQHSGNLDGIDALLGCPVKLPRLDNGLTEKIGSLTNKERHFLADCLFLIINWFREVVNAFASQTDVEMKGKVVARLHSISTLLDPLVACITDLPNYIPPPAVILDSVEPKPIVILSTVKKAPGQRKPKDTKGKAKNTKKKKGKKTSDVESGSENETENRDASREEMSLDAESEASHVISTRKGIINHRLFAPYFREFDFDVFNILQMALVASTDVVPVKVSDKLSVQPSDLYLLLDDLVAKLEHILISNPAGGKRNPFQKTRGEGANVLFCSLSELGAASVVRRTIDLLPALCHHLETISAFFQILLQALVAMDDGLLDGPRSHCTQSQLMADCLLRLLQALLALFSWTGFTLPESRSLLKKALAGLASRLSTSSVSQVTFGDLVKQAFNYMKQLSTSVPTLQVAVMQTRLLACLAAKSDSDTLKFDTGDLALSYLKKEWLNGDGLKDKGGAHNELLLTLIQLCFSRTEDVASLLQSLATDAISELMDSDTAVNDRASTTYPTLTKHTYHVFYRAMLQELVGYAKSLPPAKAPRERAERLASWAQCIKVFQTLLNLTKTFDARVNLGSALKYGRMFVELFLRQCMPMLDDMFRAHKDDVLALLKSLQLSTRALHHVCGHSKIVKDVALTNQVPQLKRSLEVFVYRVKAMLTINQCLEAFWLGNLKNRDLKGEEILSQVSRMEEEGSGSSAEESMPEDASDNSDEEKSNDTSCGIVRKKPVKRPKAAAADLNKDPQSDDSSCLQSCSETF